MLIDEGLGLLTDEECWRLLRSGEVGRVAITMSALPMIFPVNYAVVDATIVFRSSAGSKLDAAAREAIVAFEVDDYDKADRSGWSVVAVGRSEIVRDADPTGEILAAGLEPWADGQRTNLVRITPGFVTGRRIVHSHCPTNGNGHAAPTAATSSPQPAKRGEST